MPVRLTARARLAAVYIALVAVAGLVLVALTYLLVRNRPGNRVTRRGGPLEVRPPALPTLDQLRQETLNLLLTQSFVALAVVVVLAGVAGWLVAGWLLRPIRAISATAQRVSAGNLTERVPTTGPKDELTALAGTFNGMLDRVHQGIGERERLLDSQRLFVANAAHELRTPLTTMRTAIDVTLDGDPTRAELQAMIADISAAVDTSRHTLDGLLALAQGQAGSIRHDPLDLAEIARAVVGQAGAEARRRDIHLVADLHPAPTRGEETLLHRLAGNLVDNALRYNHPRGRVEVTTQTDGTSAVLRVVNTGPPVPPGDLARLFHPFVRGTGARVRAGSGAGLGLSIVAAIATAHDGAITSSTPPSGGLDLSIRLPRSTP
ncbi:ATP-binding protein [Pseudonocardia eucalypti]|uniref:histidine kinase n=1 Tax=Pseudonocardia eucalypti TaxID=648755 RepID=A0ABP9RCC6_9PSEU|nr:signal transduction histidine kinase [Pseudonocardia eucalypti]